MSLLLVGMYTQPIVSVSHYEVTFVLPIHFPATISGTIMRTAPSVEIERSQRPAREAEDVMHANM